MTTTQGLRTTARQYAGLERRLFEVLGGWVPSVPEPEAKVLLRVHSFQHAWHAQLWEDVEPRSGPVAAEPGGGVGVAGALAGVVEVVAGSATTAERLAGMYRVLLPWLVDAYQRVVAASGPSSNGPLLRAVGLMLFDDTRAIEHGQAVLAGLGADPEAVAAHAGRIGALLADIGGVGVPERN